MTVKKRKTSPRPPELTVDAASFIVFVDQPKGDFPKPTADEVVTSFDPAVAALDKRMKKERASRHKKQPSTNGDSGKEKKNAERPIESLAELLDHCLRTAGSIKNKRGTELVKLLRDARRQVELIDLR